MANAATYDEGIRLINRIKSACQLHGIDTRKATERMLAEELSRGLSKHLIPKHMIKGGLLHPQVSRETSDLDILFERKMEPQEICRAFELMKPDLAAKGIELRSYTHEPEQLYVDGYGGDRYKVCAYAGNTRINNKIEITGGTRLFPKFRPERRHGSVFFKNQEPLLGLYQTFESQASDKLIEVITNADTTRWKDFRDVSMLSKMHLDPKHIAQEVLHRLRRKQLRDYSIMDAMPEEPRALKWELAQEKAKLWHVWKEKHAPDVNNFIDVLCDGRDLYSRVRQHIVADLKLVQERHQRVLRQAEVMRNMRERYGRSAEGNVIQLSDRRDRVPAYRPKF